MLKNRTYSVKSSGSCVENILTVWAVIGIGSFLNTALAEKSSLLHKDILHRAIFLYVSGRMVVGLFILNSFFSHLVTRFLFAKVQLTRSFLLFFLFCRWRLFFLLKRQWYLFFAVNLLGRNAPFGFSGRTKAAAFLLSIDMLPGGPYVFQ